MFARTLSAASIVSKLRPVGSRGQLNSKPAQWIAANRRWISQSSRVASVRYSYAHGAVDQPLLGETTGQRLVYAAEKWPDRESHVIVHQNARFTFSTLRQKSEQLACGLLSLGLKPGDRVGVWGPNSSEWVLSQFATGVAGLVQVNINPAYRPEELAFVLRKVGCRAIIMADSFRGLDMVAFLRAIVPEIDSSPAGDLKSKNLPELKHVIMMSGKRPGMWGFDDVMSAGDSKSRRLLDDVEKKLQFDDPVNIQFTSGTTGTPKGAVLTHHGLLNMAFTAMRPMGYDKEITRLCIPLPLFHCFAMVAGSLATITGGVTCVLPTALFSGEATLKAIQDEKCTALYGTPTMFVDMLRNAKKYDLSSLRTGISGGAPCPKQLFRQVAEQLHMPQMCIGYGLTESSTAICLQNPLDPIEEKADNIGGPLAHMEVMIADKDGRIVPLGTKGELWTRGFHVMREYWDEPERTREAIGVDRWLRTGDMATLNEKGQVKIVGRIKDMIIRGGENVYPAEIEALLHKQPQLLDAHVFGIPDDRLGEEVCVWVKLKPDAKLTGEELLKFCSEHLAYYKVPRYVRFVDEFPMTATLKVQKFRMRDMELELMKKEAK